MAMATAMICHALHTLLHRLALAFRDNARLWPIDARVVVRRRPDFIAAEIQEPFAERLLTPLCIVFHRLVVYHILISGTRQLILNHFREHTPTARQFDVHVTDANYSDRYSARDQMNSPLPTQIETRMPAPSHDASIDVVQFEAIGTHVYDIGTIPRH